MELLAGRQSFSASRWEAAYPTAAMKISTHCSTSCERLPAQSHSRSEPSTPISPVSRLQIPVPSGSTRNVRMAQSGFSPVRNRRHNIGHNAKRQEAIRLQHAGCGQRSDCSGRRKSLPLPAEGELGSPWTLPAGPWFKPYGHRKRRADIFPKVTRSNRPEWSAF